jgi:hypothetical protein
MNQMSSIALCTVYAPIAQITMMIGAMIEKRYAQNRREQRHAGEHDDQACQVAQVHAGDQAPHKVFLLDEQQRPRLQAPDQQSSEQHRRSRRAGMPSASIGNKAEVPAACAAVSGAITPSIWPVPNLWPSRETRLATP